MHTDTENTMTLYLLGELPEAEMSALEAMYFAEPSFFERLLALETDLIDEYVRNRMSGDMRERFERGYMSGAARRERVRFAEALRSRIDLSVRPASSISWWRSMMASISGPRPGLRFSMAMAAFLIAVGGVWIFIGNHQRPVDEVAQTRDTNIEIQPSPVDTIPKDTGTIPSDIPANDVRPSPANNTPKPSPTPQAEKAPSSVFLALTMGSVRSGDSGSIPVLVIPRGTAEAKLSLNLKENEYPSYRLSLRSVSGGEIAERSIVKPKGANTNPNLVLSVPANKLPDGDYILTLTGIGEDRSVDDLSRSLFRVKRSN